MSTSSEDIRGSAPVMSARDLLLELHTDMKVVRPAVIALVEANLVARVGALELDHAVRDAQGGQPRALVERVAALEDVNEAELSARRAYGRVANITNRTLAAVILVANFALGVWVFLATAPVH